MDFLERMFPDLDPGQLAEMLGFSAGDDTSHADGHGTLVDEHQQSAPGIDVLMGIFPDFGVAVLEKVLENSNGNVLEAADKLSVHGIEAANLVVDGERVPPQTTWRAPRTIDFLTRSHSPTNSPTPLKSKSKSYLTSTSYSKISSQYEQEIIQPEQHPTTYRISTTSNINHSITDSEKILADDMDLTTVDAEYCLFQQAAKEFKKGTLTGRGSAQYYSDIGHQHSIQVSLWNSRAVKCMLRQNAARHNNDPSILDLHGLTKAEAVATLTSKLDDYFSRRVTGSTPLQVITGVGSHSGRGKAVILPVVVAYLKREGWKFEQAETNEGLIEVKGRR
ncbi:hypothetical protein BCR33DRAFT_721777 [Rhizoclosmatium globosum]|uniref:Smr domain-containing protein n=1 Tax=Rhizoclosmatium globosum TaxID=329046 RepID=A0A1Y2BQD3_9FUNG|nr:hypothetical protein BCR33DRAFT_721777 [Rhizoclosmatium globosum]|eukprot:ORY36847.1 hypothetical protein BCR33DRAFT_721777 [Rhizoclosmatium globosum]